MLRDVCVVYACLILLVEKLSKVPGLSELFPFRFSFTDYTDDELRELLILHAAPDKENVRLSVEAVERGIQLLGYQRARPGFANAAAVAALLKNARSRALSRLPPHRRASSGEIAISIADLTDALSPAIT